jgi:protein STE50
VYWIEGDADQKTEHGIVGQALIALKHDELKEMGITSVGHRLTILKQVYEVKVEQDIPVEADDYVPLCESTRHSIT